ncbi:MAG: type II toxin-antitoxin system RelE/ParE family toxin [Opitutae bacterium]|nr:type II toxin-antitoxin system RelE/ParE family toxin [Opitutae bacterium]
MNILWSVRARNELRAIHAYIARDSTFYADRMILRILARIEAAAQAPTRGHRVHEYPEAQFREVHEPPYRIIYAISDRTLQVVTIVHFKQELNG